MANVRNGNTYYVDSTGDLTTNKGIRLKGLVVTTSAAGGGITLQDQTTTAAKGEWKVAADEDSQLFDLSDLPIVFPNGIKVSAISNATAILILEEARN